ncbi:hypothetical protein Tco_0335104 [Tanacetum coccineum]
MGLSRYPKSPYCLSHNAVLDIQKMEIASAIVAPVVNALTVHITQKLRNLTSSAERVEHMKNRMQVLERQRAEIEVHVGDNKVNNCRIPHQVSPWLTKVEDIKNHVNKISSNNVGCNNGENHQD